MDEEAGAPKLNTGFIHTRPGSAILCAAVGGVALAIGAAAGLTYVCWPGSCCFSSDFQFFCTNAAKSPPWFLFSGLSAAPAILLTWYWRDQKRRHDERTADANRAATQADAEKARDADRAVAFATRFKSAAEMLAAEDVMTRVNAAHLLWDIARESPPHRATVADALMRFVAIAEEHTSAQQGSSNIKTTEDVKCIVTVLCREEWSAEGWLVRERRVGVSSSVVTIANSLKLLAGTLLATRGLCGADLTGANLPGAALAGANLTGADLTCANLTRASLAGASLIGATLKGASFVGSNLKGANLADANLADADLNFAFLGEANLTAVYLGDANLTDANLRDANLTDAYLMDANLTGVNLANANLNGATLAGAKLRGAALASANLTGVNLNGADLTDANLKGAALAGAKLRGAGLASANLTGVSLNGADLTNADLTNANLTGANLTNANLTGANLTNANLTGAFVDGADFAGANVDGVEPENFDFTHAIGVPLPIAPGPEQPER